MRIYSLPGMFGNRTMWASLLLALSVFDSLGETVEVQTTLGPVRGEVVSGALRFLGIPFARPPLGHLRFRPPEDPEPWTHVRNTTAFGDICMQFKPLNGLEMSEDCLSLNIYIPTPEVDTESAHKRAVMVWIHGGAWAIGAGSQNNIAPMSMRGNIIGVTINYRLGIFGFLTSGDEEIKGNAGLLDQVLALRWIQKNIEKFGGDKDRVTIFGLSAGGWSVSAHALSPMSRGLFKRAISQSGVLDRWPTPHFTTLRDKFINHVNRLGCETDNTAVMLTCLETLDAGVLMDSDPYIFPPTFSAVEDGVFFPRPLPELWGNWQNPDGIDYLAGVNQDDGDLVLWSNPAFKTTDFQYGISEERLNSIIDSIFTLTTAITPEHRSIIYDQYISSNMNNMTRVRAAIDMAGDAIFLAPTITAVEEVSSSAIGRAYMYYFQQKTPNGKKAALVSYNAGHASELFYVFGFVSESYGYTNEDSIISDTMVEAWTSFAKTGKPLVQLDDKTMISWPPYDVENRTYLSIKYPMTSLSIQQRLLPMATSFWNTLAPALSQSRSGGAEGGVTCEEDSPSRIGKNEAETALFILLAVVIVLLLATAILFANYCSLQNQLSKYESK